MRAVVGCIRALAPELLVAVLTCPSRHGIPRAVLPRNGFECEREQRGAGCQRRMLGLYDDAADPIHRSVMVRAGSQTGMPHSAPMTSRVALTAVLDIRPCDRYDVVFSVSDRNNLARRVAPRCVS